MMIIVNGKRHVIAERRQFYDDICKLAGIAIGSWPTVTYKRNGARFFFGELLPGDSISCLDGTVFNVAVTNAA